jgi:hypothetical protein
MESVFDINDSVCQQKKFLEFKDSYFENKNWRQDLVDISEKNVEFIVENDIKNIVFLDRSARLAYIGINCVWDEKYSNLKKPNIFFINPEVFKIRDFDFLNQEFTEKYRFLNTKKDENLLIYDTCIHDGKTMSSVVDFFKRVGFEKIKVGIAGEDMSNRSTVRPDLISLDFTTFPCNQFFLNLNCSKGSSLSVELNNCDWEKKESLKIRKDIKKIFEDFYTKK